jgi:ketosteroid isomerase-like protein
MSQENVEVVRRMYDAFHGGDVEGALSHFAPDVLVDASTARPDVAIGKGREHVGAVVASWITAFEEWREEIEEVRDLGGRVLVLSVQHGRGKGSGVEVEARYAILYDLHGEKITSLRMYRNPAEALEAAGLRDG